VKRGIRERGNFPLSVRAINVKKKNKEVGKRFRQTFIVSLFVSFSPSTLTYKEKRKAKEAAHCASNS
jgi:hypothetical protein